MDRAWFGKVGRMGLAMRLGLSSSLFFFGGIVVIRCLNVGRDLGLLFLYSYHVGLEDGMLSPSLSFSILSFQSYFEKTVRRSDLHLNNITLCSASVQHGQTTSPGACAKLWT